MYRSRRGLLCLCSLAASAPEKARPAVPPPAPFPASCASVSRLSPSPPRYVGGGSCRGNKPQQVWRDEATFMWAWVSAGPVLCRSGLQKIRGFCSSSASKLSLPPWSPREPGCPPLWPQGLSLSVLSGRQPGRDVAPWASLPSPPPQGDLLRGG